MGLRTKSDDRRVLLVLVLSSSLVACGVVMTGVALTDRGAVMVHHEHQPSRAEMIRMWRALLENDGRSLPDNTSIMSTEAVQDAWGTERMRQAKPQEMPHVTVCSVWWDTFKPSCW